MCDDRSHCRLPPLHVHRIYCLHVQATPHHSPLAFISRRNPITSANDGNRLVTTMPSQPLVTSSHREYPTIANSLDRLDFVLLGSYLTTILVAMVTVGGAVLAAAQRHAGRAEVLARGQLLLQALPLDVVPANTSIGRCVQGHTEILVTSRNAPSR